MGALNANGDVLEKNSREFIVAVTEKHSRVLARARVQQPDLTCPLVLRGIVFACTNHELSIDCTSY